jgi:hypothetical protein
MSQCESRPARALALLASVLLAACGSTSAPAAVTETPGTPVTARCTAPNRSTGVQFGANVNVLFWESHYDDTQLLAAVRSLGNPVVRLPGGTEADYFDWALGRPVDSCRYGGCRTWDSAQLTPPGLFQRFGSFRNGTSSVFATFARDVNGTLLLVANTMTASVEDNVRWISAVPGVSGNAPLIELGNEPYFAQVEGTDNTARLYPTGASHVAYAKRLAAALRTLAPSARLAYPAFVPRVDATTGVPDGAHDARMLTWNEQILAAGIANDVDAFALHFYPRLPGRRGASEADYLRTLGRYAEQYWSATVRQPQWALLPSGKRLWVTELNASFADAPELIGTWMHGLMQAQLMLLMLQDPRMDVLLQHMLSGNAQWQAVVHPGRAPDIAPAPGFTPYALTASGEALAALSGALRGATCIESVPAPTPATIIVAARDGSTPRVLIVNASADTVTLDVRTLGFSRITATERRAPPLAKPGAGAALTVTPLNTGADGRTVRIAPYAIVTMSGA